MRLLIGLPVCLGVAALTSVAQAQAQVQGQRATTPVTGRSVAQVQRATPVTGPTVVPSPPEDGLRLRWQAPASCPSADDVRAATLARGGESARGAKEATREVLEADAHVEQRRSGWRVRLRTKRGAASGEREIEASTCRGVADATAVVLALALVPPGAAPEEAVSATTFVATNGSNGLTPTGAASSAPGAGAVATPPTSTEPEPDRDGAAEERARPVGLARSEGPHRFAIGASVSGDAATLPLPTLGGSLTVAFTPGRWRFEIDGRRWATQSRSLAASDAGARFSLTSGGGRGCWTALRAGRIDLAPCAGGDIHFVSAPGYGADANYAATAAWVTLTGGVLGRVNLASWLAIRSRVEAFVPLSRPTFVVEGEGSVHRPPTLGVAASLGAEVLFL